MSKAPCTCSRGRREEATVVEVVLVRGWTVYVFTREAGGGDGGGHHHRRSPRGNPAAQEPVTEQAPPPRQAPQQSAKRGEPSAVLTPWFLVLVFECIIHKINSLIYKTHVTPMNWKSNQKLANTDYDLADLVTAMPESKVV